MMAVKNVRIIEWRGRLGPTSRWAARYFKDVGCRVYVTDSQDTRGLVDLVYTPIPGLPRPNAPTKLFTQLEGYGEAAIMPGSAPSSRIEATFENSHEVMLADPNIHVELEKNGVGGDPIMLPNPAPDVDIPPRNTPNFTVFIPMGTWDIKKPERAVQAARIVGEEEPSITFQMIISSRRSWSCPLDWLELDNIQFRPVVPYEDMLKLYGIADVVAPFSAAEVLPWTVFEGFISGKPTIVDVAGRIQTVHREHIEEMTSWYGASSDLFHRRWKEYYGSGEGDHYLHAGSAEELAQLILELYGDEKRRLELGNRAIEWVGEYDEHWSFGDKGRKIIELTKEVGFH